MDAVVEAWMGKSWNLMKNQVVCDEFQQKMLIFRPIKHPFHINYESNHPLALIKNQQLNCAIMDGFQPLTFIIPDPSELLLIILCLIIALLNPSRAFYSIAHAPMTLWWFCYFWTALSVSYLLLLLLFALRTGS